MLAWSKSIGRCTVSFISVLLTQLALFLVPLFCSASPILIQLTLSALVLVVVLGFGGWCKRLLGFNASAPAFVFCSILFIWGVYIAIVRQGTFFAFFLFGIVSAYSFWSSFGADHTSTGWHCLESSWSFRLKRLPQTRFTERECFRRDAATYDHLLCASDPAWRYHSPSICFIFAAISPVMDVVFNVEMIMLIIGLFRLFFFSLQSFATSIIWIMLKDPGFMVRESFSLDELNENSVLGVQTHNESSLLQMRARYCKSCQTYVQGFDHHCPAFGNCIGQKNYVLFMVLLVGFITAEISYIVCSSQFASKFRVLEENRVESGSILVMARSTLLFCVLQVLWQGPFLIWHVYCICFNIRTEEWVNWKKYPEFQLNASSLSGDTFL
ncbi:hypothetical protein CXB51_007599 [Gossypium anomalum]|uniref:S-acyltransferase n=1 Tax=Gossypium anomalum TaxID=47600 RepID=A0A8J5ZI81_9ROSI|nr:hypothetical protein CXB51_007599 [Gossypium anomalum]